VVGEAVLGFGEAGIVFDDSAAVGVGEEEEADRLGRGCGLCILADREVGNGGLLEVWDGSAFRVDHGGPGGIDWRGRDEGGEKLGPFDRLARFRFRSHGGWR